MSEQTTVPRLRVGARVLVSAKGVGTVVAIEPPYFPEYGRRIRVNFGPSYCSSCKRHGPDRIEVSDEMHVTVCRG